MELTIVFILFLFAGCCFWLVSLMNKSENNGEQKRLIKVEELIKEKQIQIGKRFDSKSRFTIIHDFKNSCFWGIFGLTQYAVKRINYSDILKVELKEDEIPINVTSRTSQIGGAIVGGALAGGTGAIIGGLSGKQIQKRTVSSIKLIVTVDDLNRPFLEFIFASFYKPVETTSREYNDAHSEAFTWFKTMEVLINRNEKGQNEKA